PVTTIIDDAFAGDSDTSILYSPANAWGLGSTTGHGRIAPDPSLAQDETWHDTTDDTTPDHDGTTPTFMEVNFQGTGIDVRCIIVNNKADPSIPPFTGTKANYSFFIDTVPQNRDYIREAGTTGDAFLYNTSVFSTNGLSNGPHKLKLLLNGGPEVDGSVLLLFDSAIVTSDDGTGNGGSGTTAGGTTQTVLPPSGPTSAPAKISTTLTGASVKPSSTSSSSQSRTAGPGNSTTSTGGVVESQEATSATPTPSVPAPPSSSSQGLSSAHRKSNINIIIGGLVGGLLTLLLLIIFLCWSCRRRSRRLRIPKILPLPHFRPRSLTPRKTDTADPSPPSSSPQKHNPNRPPQSTLPSVPSAQSTADPEIRDYVQRLREEVERLREQQREMVAMQRISLPEPPPRYEEA
ncbi:hypothetical protein B0H13DRAFT_2035200, partial [Mycena leptocephala]